MTETIVGQLDLFEELGEPAPVPPFMVHISVWAENGCGWCHSKSTEGGGACRNPANKDESFFYSYCGKCRAKYGYPRVTAPGYPLVIDRTIKPRPGTAPNLNRKACAAESLAGS